MSGRKKGPPFVQLELDALNKMDPAARLAGVERWSLIGRLAELWAYGLRSQRETYDINEVRAFLVGKDEPADKVIGALATFNFLQIDGPTIRVCGIGRYFPNEGRKQAAAETNEKKRAKNESKMVHDRTGTVTVNARSAPQDGPTWGESGEDGASLPADRDGQATVPRIWDLGFRIENASFEPLEPKEEFPAGEAQAAAVLSGRTGDHAAREDDMPSAGDLARKDRVVAGLFKALSQPATPEAPAAPPLDEHAPPNTSPAPRPAAPAINEMRPSAETPEQPAQQTPTSPGEEDEFVWQMDDIHQRVRGRPYQWKDIDRDILDELRIEGFTAQQILEWWEGALGDKGRRIRYLRELKALMLKELRPEPPKARPGRVDPDDGILRGTL